VRPPLTPPVTNAETMEPISSPDAAAVPVKPNTALSTWPPTPPSIAPAMPQRPEIDVLGKISRSVAAERAGDELNDQCRQVR
jgi:hypothetical protein